MYKPITKTQRKEESIQIWRNIRKKGSLSCHGHGIPPKCAVGICDLYPEVDLCYTCNQCPCSTWSSYRQTSGQD